jgi:hypothetical protein
MQPGREARLGQEHRAELAAPDQTGPDRLAGGGALCEKTMEVHGHP